MIKIGVPYYSRSKLPNYANFNAMWKLHKLSEMTLMEIPIVIVVVIYYVKYTKFILLCTLMLHLFDKT